MKQFLISIFFIGSISVFSQIQGSGAWIVKGKKGLDSAYNDIWVWTDTSLYLPDTAFAPILSDSIRTKYVYRGAPDLILFNKYGSMVLAYGDIMDSDGWMVAKERVLRSEEGDCIFAWEPSTSMYEYVITWNKDHYVYYTAGGDEYHYEPFDTEVLSQQQQQKLVPMKEDLIYFQGRLRPVHNYYHCNIPDKK